MHIILTYGILIYILCCKIAPLLRNKFYKFRLKYQIEKMDEEKYKILSEINISLSQSRNKTEKNNFMLDYLIIFTGGVVPIKIIELKKSFTGFLT